MNAPFFFYVDLRVGATPGSRIVLLVRERRIEESGRQGKRLTARGSNDPDSLNSRSGRLHGYRDELEPQTIAFIEAHLQEHLDPVFQH